MVRSILYINVYIYILCQYIYIFWANTHELCFCIQENEKTKMDIDGLRIIPEDLLDKGNKIGGGTFCNVYKGNLDNTTVVLKEYKPNCEFYTYLHY